MKVLKKQGNIKASVLIVNYKQNKDVISLLKQLNNLEGFEFLIFNNSPSSKLRLKTQNCRVFNLHKNIGYGAAVNYLATRALGDYIFILNPDISIENSLNGALKEYKELPINFAVYSLGKKEHLYSIPIFSRFLARYRFSSYAFLTSKSLFKSIGGFDIDFFMYFEDDDLSLRLKRLKLETYFPPKIYASHKKTYKNMIYQERKILYYTSLKMYLWKHTKLSFFIFYLPIQIKMFLSEILNVTDKNKYARKI